MKIKPHNNAGKIKPRKSEGGGSNKLKGIVEKKKASSSLSQGGMIREGYKGFTGYQSY